MTNPFRYGQIATGEFFADRASETERLVAEALAGQNTVIISPRRYGKTSVGLHAREQLQHQKVKSSLVSWALVIRSSLNMRLSRRSPSSAIR